MPYFLVNQMPEVNVDLGHWCVPDVSDFVSQYQPVHLSGAGHADDSCLIQPVLCGHPHPQLHHAPVPQQPTVPPGK